MAAMKDSKHPCLISSDALWILAASGGAMLLLPLTEVERMRVEEACAQAHKAILAAAGMPPAMLHLDWIDEYMEGLTDV